MKDKYGFSGIVEMIEDKNYEDAQSALDLLLDIDDAEVSARVNYLLGYINTRSDFKQRNHSVARRCLYNNINSSYPNPWSYVFYSRLKEDKNIAENYLRKGAARFPDNTEIYNEWLRISANKAFVVQEIKKSGISNKFLLGAVLSYLISEQKWEATKQFVFRIQNNNELDDEENLFLGLIHAYAFMFGSNVDYDKAEELLEKIIIDDTDNDLSYSHYLGIIYVNIKKDNLSKAIEYFDRLPTSNAITDFNEYPYPLGIEMDFEKQYKIIFDLLAEVFAKDKSRKEKAAVLYVLYLYHPSIIFDVYRYKKTDMMVLARYLKKQFNEYVARALYDMYIYYKMYEDAYTILWRFINKGENPDKQCVFISEIIQELSSFELIKIANLTLEHLENEEYDKGIFLSCVFDELVKALYRSKLYGKIRDLAGYLSLGEIVETESAFECAYAYGEIDDNMSVLIYKALAKQNPKNSAVINNLGVQYEHKNELYNALRCYQEALAITPDDEIQKRNLQRIRETINQHIDEELQEIKELLTFAEIKDIGYNVELCQKIQNIEDEEFKKIIFRDVKECAIAVISHQDKMATIMCGSIIEAILVQKLIENGVIKYEKRGKTYDVNTLGLNDLLEAADDAKIIDASSYHLGHYIRNYRNVVHPAKEIRMKEDVSHSNVIMMWSVLTRIINELY